VRILARAWLGVIWRCWQRHQSHQPDRHRGVEYMAGGLGAV